MHLYVTICMKLVPGMHIGVHLVSFGKSGVTGSPRPPYIGQRIRSVPKLLVGYDQET
jgi:hypothetical protein